MMMFVIGFMGIAMLFGAYTLAHSIFNVLKEQFEELMPQRMVDLAGFVEVPHRN